MEEEHDELVHSGVTIAGRYKVVSKLGEGGMGSVLLVQHVHTEEKLALKVLHSAVIKDTSALERFRREARTPARIDSDYVVRVTDADVADEIGGAPFLVMEYLRGKDLEDTIDDEGPQSPTVTVRVLRQVARALDKAHRIGIIHRDLKPENIFLARREDGTSDAKILDFGIAKFTSKSGEEMAKTAATSPGAIFGTPLYMSPEQAKGESDNISPQTDIWALGLIAHKMLTGKDLWTAETLAHLIAQIAYEPLPIPSENGALLGKEYDEWLLTCCARKPEERFQSAGQAIAELARALGMGISETTFDGTEEVPSVGPRSEAVGASSGSVRATAFSKTDAQLATSKAGARKERSGMMPVIAGGFLLFGVVGALVWLKPWSSEPAGTGPESVQSGATVEKPDDKVGGVPSPVVEPGPTADPTPTPTTSATAEPSAEPTTDPPPPNSAPPPPNTAPPPPNTAITPPPPKDPPPPAPPVDPLSGRH